MEAAVAAEVTAVADVIRTAPALEVIRTVILAAAQGIPVYISARLYNTVFREAFEKLGIEVEEAPEPAEPNCIVIDDDSTRFNMVVRAGGVERRLPISAVREALAKLVDELAGFKLNARYVRVVSVPRGVVEAARRRRKG